MQRHRGMLEYSFSKPGSPQCHLPSQLNKDVSVSTIPGALSALEALCDYALYKTTFTLHYITYSFPGTFVPMMELSFSGPFIPWNFRSQDYSFSGTFVPWTVRSRDRSFPKWINTADLSLLGPFVPWTVHSLELLFQGLYSQKVVNGGRWYDDRIMGVRSAIAIHETYRMYDRHKF